MKRQIFLNQSSPKLFLFIALLFLMSANGVVHAQTTTFTYQGRLNSGAAPANGLYDLQFTVYDSSSAGLIVGQPGDPRTFGVTLRVDFKSK